MSSTTSLGSVLSSFTAPARCSGAQCGAPQPIAAFDDGIQQCCALSDAHLAWVVPMPAASKPPDPRLDYPGCAVKSHTCKLEFADKRRLHRAMLAVKGMRRSLKLAALPEFALLDRVRIRSATIIGSSRHS